MNLSELLLNAFSSMSTLKRTGVEFVSCDNAKSYEFMKHFRRLARPVMKHFAS